MITSTSYQENIQVHVTSDHSGTKVNLSLSGAHVYLATLSLLYRILSMDAKEVDNNKVLGNNKVAGNNKEVDNNMVAGNNKVAGNSDQVCDS